MPERATTAVRPAEREVSRGHSSRAEAVAEADEGPNDGEGAMLAPSVRRRPQKSGSNPERQPVRAVNPQTTSGRVANLIVGNGHRRPGNCLNLSNRPVRTRMPGGVGGEESQDSPLSRLPKAGP